MQIIEQFICGKSGDGRLCEDKIVITPDFIAVLDGATSRQGLTLGGWSNGRFAAEVLAVGIENLPAGATAKEAVVSLTRQLRHASEAAADREGKGFSEIWSWPAAAGLFYSKARREIWRVADSSFINAGKANYRVFPQEEVWSQLRRAFIFSRLARGESEESLQARDPSWDVLTPLIAEFKVFANHAGEYGYGVFNGFDIPDMHIEVFPADITQDIIFASDGYPEIFPTLAETEAQLEGILAEDPLLYKRCPQVKGVKTGHLSFDDRSYIRFRAVAGPEAG